MNRRSLLAATGLLFFTTSLFAQAPPAEEGCARFAGHWEGRMARGTATLDVSFDFRPAGGALASSFNAPDLRALGIPLTAVRCGEGLHFELVGDESATVFDGTLGRDRLSGGFREGDSTGSFVLRRTKLGPVPYREEEVRFRNGAAVLAGSLLIPRTPGKHPAVVFQHGSGPEGRFGSRFWADFLARRGIAALIYDKRGVGESTGDWRRSTFTDLADDAIAGIRLLATRSEIDPRRIGIYGHSQGGFIAPLIVARAPEVAFVIAGASPGGPAWQQDLYRVGRAVQQHQGFAPAEREQAMGVYKRFLEAARSGQGIEEYAASVAGLKNEPWYQWLALPDPGDWLWSYYRGTGNYDSLPYWEKVRVPVLLVYGKNDALVPAGESVAKIEEALRRAGNRDFAAMILPGAAHNFNVDPPEGSGDWPRLSPGYPDLLAAWILYHTTSRSSG